MLRSASLEASSLVTKRPANHLSELEERPAVFIVEDDEAALHSAEVLLTSMGYAVRTFHSCEEFLADTEQAEGNYLLLDYRFDGITGLQLLDQLRGRGIFMPTIIFTGVFDASVKRRARLYDEVVAVLNKPVGLRSLRHALRNARTLLQSRTNGSHPFH